MNYFQQGAGGIRDASKNIRFDFSSKKLPDLDEDHLNETVGIQGNSDYSYFYCKDNSVRFFLEEQKVDWNCDGKFDVDTNANINGNDITPSELQFETNLESYDDWNNLQYRFRDSRSYADGVRGEVTNPDQEYNTQIAEKAGTNYLYQNVIIDVRPSNPTNVVNLNETMLPVAILSSDIFDATKIITNTVRMFGGAPVKSEKTKDINKDGKTDIILYFDVRTFDLITPNSIIATVSGKTEDKIYFLGEDRIKIVP